MPPRRRPRRNNGRPVEMRKLDQPVMMAAYTQNSPNWLEWRARRISLRKALEMKAAGEAQAVTRKSANGIVTFFRETKPTRPGVPTPCTLTLATINAVARDTDRNKKDNPGLNSREYAQVVKFRVWPLIGDTRAVAVRPRITDRERQFAEKLLEKAKGRAVTIGKSRNERSEVRAEYYDEPAMAAA